jgi:hypothetical protein
MQIALLAIAAGLALSITAFAQPQPQPIEPPRNDEPVQPTRPAPAQSAIPSIKPTPLPEADAALPPPRKLPEGTFLTTRAGRLVKARTGDTIFLPDPVEGGATLPAMVLLPSQRLAQIETTMAAPGFSGDVIIGGQVFVYRGHEYLLPTTFSQPAPAKPEPAGATQPPAPATNPATDSDPRVEDLIKDLESQRSAPRALTPNTPANTATPPDPKDNAPVMQEGTLMTFKRARIIRLPDHAGRVAIAFDNDPNSPAPAPMIVQPCAELQRLESLAASRGDALALKVSGRVLTYKSRNYFLPTLIQTTSPGEVVPMQ